MDGEARAGCFALFVFLMSCSCNCSVALPHDSVGWYAVCNCGKSLSYSLDFFSFRTTIVRLDMHKFAIKMIMNMGLIDDQSNLETCLSINLI